MKREKTSLLAPAVDLWAQIRIMREGKDVYTGPAKLVPFDGVGLAVTVRLKLPASMTPDHYYLEVIAADRFRNHALNRLRLVKDGTGLQGLLRTCRSVRTAPRAAC